MGTTAEKLSYLNTTKAKIKDAINLGDANITTETFRQYEKKIKQALINTMLDKWGIWDNFEKVTGTNTSLSLSPTSLAPISIDLKGNTQQDGEPTPDSPVDVNVVSGDNTITISNSDNTETQSQLIDLRIGENLFDISKIEENTYITENGTTGASVSTNLSDYIRIDSNTNYTLSYDYSSLINSNQRNFVYYNENKTFITGEIYLPTIKVHTITTPSNAKYIRFSYDKNCFNIQLKSGISATSWEAYNSIELCKIDNYQDRIFKSSGKNLFDKNNITRIVSGTISSDVITSNAISSNWGGVSANFTGITLSAGTYYISLKAKLVSGTTNGVNKILSNLSSTTIVTKPALSSSYQVYCEKIETNQEITLSNIGLQLTTGNTNAVISFTDIMISKSSDSTYEPYGTDWYKYSAIGKVVLDGSEFWDKIDNSTPDYIYVVSTAIDDIAGYGTFLEYSNYFSQPTRKITPSYVTDKPVISGTDSNEGVRIRILVPTSTADSLNNFKTWLSTHNTTVYYVLATPTYEEITDTTLISQLEAIKNMNSYNGTTNISQENNDLGFILDIKAIKEI